MPKLPVVSGRELIKYLSRKGFRVVRQRSSHVFMANDGKRTTVPLHDELDPGTLLDILSQVGIDKEDFAKEWR